ncbi:ferredoxin reductase family protein [Pseudomonas citronellolis]|uniref:ferredoxin reductase family protein n=1 Tax=Pseudomonas citronellolis TaxID=53408 RepID=UPI0023E476F7|nr:ferric reductase-like transmembrane domain-containing protein [Pseudomonas citronellolis]MDF3936508.1 ferric reductase-like transmembrane domain-containing protein [Pseudomonas citronellolis]
MKLVWIVLAAVLATFGLALVLDPPATFDIWVLRKQAILLTGVAAFALMSLIMLLAVRPVWLERPLGGLDRMYRAHKWAGILAISLGLLHYLLELGGPLLAEFIAKPAKGPRVETFLDVFRGSAKELGEWSAWLLAAMLVLTLWQRFPYRVWRYVHKTLALVYLVLAFHAVVLAPAGYWTQPVGWLVALCAALGSACALIALSGRIGRRRTHRGVVVAVARPDERLLEVTCRLDRAWTHKAGQFAFLTCERLEGQHPFTISSADRGNGEVRFSIKALGDYTRRLQTSLAVGDPVKVEGPYGCFDFRRGGGRQVWIAGGIGITPFLAWLEALQRHPADAPEVELHYCVRSPADAIYAGHLRDLCDALPSVTLKVHYSAEEGYLRGDDLGMAPDARGRWPSLWFCGPQGLADLLRRDLGRRGMPSGNFHQEAFRMR